jgi:hypothetical protein
MSAQIVPDYSNAPDDLFAAPIYMPVVLNFEFDKAIMFGHGGNPYVSLYSQESAIEGRVSSDKAAFLATLPGRAEEGYLPRMPGASQDVSVAGQATDVYFVFDEGGASEAWHPVWARDNWSNLADPGGPSPAYRTIQLDSYSVGHYQDEYDLLPSTSRLELPGYGAMQSFDLQLGGRRAFRSSMYLTPTVDASPDIAFIDCFLPSEIIDFYAEVSGNNSLLAGLPNQNFFTGLIKTAAKNKALTDIVPTDVMLGVLVVGQSAKVIINGVVEWQRTNLPLGQRQAVLYGYVVHPEPVFAIEAQKPVPSDYSTIQFHVTRGAVAKYPSESWESVGEISNTVFSIDLAGCALLTASDCDIDPVWGHVSVYSPVGTFDSRVMFSGPSDHPVAFGATYSGAEPPRFWTQRIRTTEVI